MAQIRGTEFELDDWTKENTGPRMRAFLLHTRKSQMAMAIFLGVSVTSVSRWCCGKNVPDFRTRRTIQNVIEGGL
jgi:transcriptional regulator with XRE-family HTH domain